MNVPFFIARKYFWAKNKPTLKGMYRALRVTGLSALILIVLFILTYSALSLFGLENSNLALVLYLVETLGLFVSRFVYLIKSGKSINIISLISMVVVAIGTMSLIIALSVFNGLEGLLRNMYGNFDPDIIISPSKGKSFQFGDQDLALIEKTDGVLGVTQVIEDNVLVRYKESQRVVRLKGVSRAFDEFSGIKNAMVSGQFSLVEDSIGYAVIGRGIQYDLSINLNNDFYALQIYYPKNIGPGVVNPKRMYNELTIIPGGVFAIEKYYDENFVFVPIEFARELLNYGERITSYEIYLNDSVDPLETKAHIQNVLGDSYNVIVGDELHSDLYKVLKIEKLFVFLILIAIIGIASINIFFCLTMLVIEKKKDISVLFAQGASERLIRSIFLFEGGIIAFTGAFIGLILGIVISFIQQEYGIIGMGMQAAVINSYPVKIELMDIFYTVIAIVIITVLAALQPAIKASKSFSVHILQ